MLKRFLLLSAVSLSLTACETMNEMSWPTLPEMPSISSLNPFGTDGQSGKVDDESESDAPNMPNDPQSLVMASDIELSEIEKLTGHRPTPKPRGPVTDMIDDLAMDKMPSAPMPQVNVERLDNQKTEMMAESVEKVEDKKIDVPVVTKQDVKQEVQEIAKAETQKPMMQEPTMDKAMTATCPVVKIMPVAKSMTNFNKDMAGQMTSRATIDEVRGGCEFVNGGMEVDLDILMTGQITNAGRDAKDNKNEEFVSFPYFVSVLNPSKKPIDKDILSSVIHFRPMVNQSKHAEKITQMIAMNDPQNAGNYTIIVGYQLSRQQLEYNRASGSKKTKSYAPVSRDVSQPRRISTNPL